MKFSKEKAILKKQLGREARNIVGIPIKCSAKFPQVIVTAPILEKNNSILPTTLWLTCPELNYRIAQLEDRGQITKIKEKIDKNERLRKELMKAHQRYADYRLSLMSEYELERLKRENEGQYRVIKESGVGGIMDFGGLKCLHTHYAHYLVKRHNPVGRLTHERLITEYPALNPVECKQKCEVEG